jgi:hypothetical protein
LSTDHILTELHYDELETRSLPISAVSSTRHHLLKNVSNSSISLPLNAEEIPILSPFPIPMESANGIFDSELTPKWSSKILEPEKQEVYIADWSLDINRQFLNQNNYSSENDHFYSAFDSAACNSTANKPSTKDHSDISVGALEAKLLELHEEINALSEDNNDLERLLLVKSKESEDKGQIIADMWKDFERLESENKTAVSEAERLREAAHVRYNRIIFEKQRDIDLIYQKSLKIEEQDNVIAVNQLRILELDKEISDLKGGSNSIFSRYLPIIETMPPESSNNVKLLENEIYEKDQIISGLRLKYDELLNRSSNTNIDSEEKRQNPSESDSELFIPQTIIIPNENDESFSDIMHPNEDQISAVIDIIDSKTTSPNSDAQNTKISGISSDENNSVLENSLNPVYSIFRDERIDSVDIYLNQISILNAVRADHLNTIDILRKEIVEFQKKSLENITSNDLIMSESQSKQYLIVKGLEKNLQDKVDETR